MDSKTKNSCFMEDLYRRHERLMYFIAGKYTANAQGREDIVQTAVVSLLRKEATLRHLPPYAQINYIAAAVRNTAINSLKREQKKLDRCISLEDLSETFPTKFMPSAEAITMEKELQKDLLAVFQEMKEDEQQLLMGKYLMDLSDAGARANAWVQGFQHPNEAHQSQTDIHEKTSRWR